MAPNLNASRARKGNGGRNSGDKTPRENVAVQVASVHSADPKKPTPSADYIEAFLLHDAFGMKAEIDPDGTPRTLIRAKVDVTANGRYYEGQDPTKMPTEMYDLGKGRRKGTGGKMGDNPVVILEKACLNKQTNEVEVSFISIGMRDPTSAAELVIENVMTTVYEERTNDETGRKTQNRSIFMTDEAVEVTSMEQLKEVMVAKLGDDRADRKFAMIHLVGRDIQKDSREEDGKEIPQYPYQALSFKVNLGYDTVAQTSLSPEATVEAWFADEKNADDVATIEQCLVPENRMMVEVIAGFNYPTGKNSLPSAKGRRSDHYAFQMPWEQSETGAKGSDKAGNPYVMPGVAAGHITLGRVDGEDGLGAWFAKNSFPIRSFAPPLFRERELITPNTPPEVAEVFTAQANRRAAEHIADFRARQEKSKPAEDQIKQSSEDEFDPSAGRSMSMGR